MTQTYGISPLSGMDCSFQRYLEKRNAARSSHLVNGLPDYAFSLDYELRKKLDAIPGLYGLAKKVGATFVSNEIQKMNIDSIAVGPTQFPDVYEMGCDCAKRLGIGIPNIYIKNSPVMNAYTYAFDDTEPIIVIHSALYERLTPDELKSVIGHECGHIHNNHGVYHFAAMVLQDAALTAGDGHLSVFTLLALSAGAQLALSAWSRAAEVSCDRAGMICCDRPESAYSSEVKLMYGATFNKEQTIDYQALREQLKMQQGNINKYHELLYSHPSGARRVAADMEFAECETFYKWRPDLHTPGVTMRTREETDARCRQIIDVSKKG